MTDGTSPRSPEVSSELLSDPAAVLFGLKHQLCCSAHRTPNGRPRMRSIAGVTTESDHLATPRIAAGVLFRDDRRRVLLVKPTYKDGWGRFREAT